MGAIPGQECYNRSDKTMSNPILFVINPAAGRGRVGRMMPRLEAVIRQISGSQPVEIAVTQAPGHGTQLARQAPEGSTVVAVGGDGTVHEVVRGIAGAEKTMGVVPIGSGNDFARMIGLKGKSLEDSLKIALQGQRSPVDLGMVNGHAFGASLGIGFDAAVARKAFDAPKFLRGMPRYLYSLLLVLKELSLPELEIIAEASNTQSPIYQGKALLAALMNASTYGGGIPIVPGASPTDGLLSGAVAGEFTRLGVLGILPQLLQGKHIHNPKVKLFAGTRFRLRFDRPTPAALDGELIEPQSEYRVELIPAGLNVIKE